MKKGSLFQRMAAAPHIVWMILFIVAPMLFVLYFAFTDANGNEAAFLYNWDGSGEAGTDSDLYFNASIGGNTYTFVVEYYLCNETTDVYNAVRGLNVGDTIDIEGFLYWYEGAQPHVTSVIVK